MYLLSVISFKVKGKFAIQIGNKIVQLLFKIKQELKKVRKFDRSQKILEIAYKVWPHKH